MVSLLFPKQIGMGKFEVLGKFAIAEFTNGDPVPVEIPPVAPNVTYRQKTTEVNVDYVIKQFDARVMSFYKDTRFNEVMPNTWEAGIGLQLQISKTIK